MLARLAALLAACVLAGCNRQAPGPPYTPAESIRKMQVEDGFRVEEFLAEPAITSPVAMEIDEDGRWWVVEDRGYPLDTTQVGRIRLLEDTNGDGKPDKFTTFADKLTLPTGIMRWKKGVLVTDPPNLLYLEDTDGDGRADIRKPILTGFAFTNPQHTVNSPVYGLDNWIYLAHERPAGSVIYKDKFGDRGSSIRYADREGGPSLDANGRNLRFQPDLGTLEALSGTSQFGQAFDPYGRHFTLNNTYHVRHEVIAARHLKRNPDLPLRTSMADISDHGVPAKVFPLVARQRVEMLTTVGEFTSASGLTYFNGSLIVGEPAHNLAHRDLLVPHGATFSAKRTQPAAEFIASSDPWFRPVNFYVGPTGALYMLDYYRMTIEHPEWMSTEAQTSKDLTAGIDRGRIYRIVSAEHPPAPYAPLRLSTASTAELVACLDRDNPWFRRTAQRLLVDRKPADAPAKVAALLDSPNPITRVHALWTLEGLGALEAAQIDKALSDSEPGVRENAIRLTERHWGSKPALTPALAKLAQDPDARVRFQLLAALGSAPTPEARAIRDGILFRDIADPWVHAAALSAGPAEARRLLDAALAHRNGDQHRLAFLQQAASVIGAGRKADEIRATLARIGHATPAAQTAVLDGLGNGLRGAVPHEVVTAVQPALLALFAGSDAAVRRAALRLLDATGVTQVPPAVRKKAVADATDPKTAPALRADSIGLIALSDPAAHQALLKELVDPKEPEDVQIAACRALGRIDGDGPSEFLIANWRNMTAAVRAEAADAIYRDASRIPLVLDALQQGAIQPWTLSFRHKARLVMNPDPKLRQAARRILEESAGDRAAVVRAYQPALDLAANPAQGKQVFDQICRKCHQLDGKGAAVGPDLATVRGQPKQALLTSILDPNQSISQGFEAFVVETSSGETVDGVIGPQTPAAITLRHEEGKEDVIQRKDIRSMRASALSAMPADLEKQINVQQMADLLEYLKRR